MKTPIFIFLVLMTACRASRERNINLSTTKQSAVSRDHQALYLWHQLDSNARYWYYSSDTSFYYHPDQGLYANRGNLYIEESQEINTTFQAEKNNTYHNEQEQYSQRKYQSSKNARWSLWAIGLSILVAVMLYRWRRVTKS